MQETQNGSPEHLIRVGCPAHNCGGRCLLVAHVRDGIITRLDTDDRPDTLAVPSGITLWLSKTSLISAGTLTILTGWE